MSAKFRPKKYNRSRRRYVTSIPAVPEPRQKWGWVRLILVVIFILAITLGLDVLLGEPNFWNNWGR